MKYSLISKLFVAFGMASSITACAKTDRPNTPTAETKVIFLAGATGVIGEPLGKALVAKGYRVYGTTRSESKAKQLENNGVKPVILDVFDRAALEKAVLVAKPDVVINELSALPKGLKESEMAEGLKRDAKIRIEGSKNLIAAAEKAGVTKYITQSFMFYAPSHSPLTEQSPLLPTTDEYYGESIKSVISQEQQALAGKFTPVVLRYGWIYGGKSGFDAPVAGYPSVNIEAVVDATVRAVEADIQGVYNIADESPLIDVSKFKNAVPDWQYQGGQQ